MSEQSLIWLILGMMVLTAGPRILPALLEFHKRLPAPLLRGLPYLPVAALSALVVPGVFSLSDSLWIILAVIGLTVVLSFFRRNNLLVTAGAAFFVFMMLQKL